MKRILFLQNLIYPIRDPFFEKLNKKKGIDIFVIFLSKTATNRKWKVERSETQYPSKISLNYKFPFFNGTFDLILNPLILVDYIKIRHDVLISIGWANPANYFLCLLSYYRKIPYYLWIESTMYENSVQRKILMPLIKLLVKYSSGCIVPGSASKKYVQSINKKTKVLLVPNAINNKRIKQKNTNNNIPIILYVGRFSKEKNIIFLLEIIKKLEQKYKFYVWLIGYGPEKIKIKSYIEKNKISSIKKLEYGSYDQIAHIYSKADIFVLPSKQEPWGFVINEAMAAGLPVISSNTVGATQDLLEDGYNGYLFKSGNYRELEEKIIFLLKNKKLRQRMGKNSLKAISKITYQNMVDILYENI